MGTPLSSRYEGSVTMTDLATWKIDPFTYFKKFDKNKDGKLSAAELKPALQSIGFNPTDKDVAALIAAADDDGDGAIEYERGEFIKVLAAFQFLDKDGSGTISAEELRNLLMNHGDGQMSLEEANQLLAKADSNGDGVIDYNEFFEMFSHTT